jgi:hypothetical protein
MHEQIKETSIEESFYQTDDQPGYNLISKTIVSKPLLAAPGKKKKLLPSSLLFLPSRSPLLQNNSRSLCSPKLRNKCPLELLLMR